MISTLYFSPRSPQNLRASSEECVLMTNGWLPSTICAHALLDFLQIFRDKRVRGVEIVIEAVFNRRPDA